MSHELILVIDHQEYWREFSKKALEAANFNVYTHDTSTYLKAYNEHSRFPKDVYESKMLPRQEQAFTTAHYREEEGGNRDLPLEQRPDLIIVGCTQVGQEEQILIEHLLTAQHHLLVVCTFLPRQVMRSLFLQGVDDVTDKPYTSTDLITIVQNVLQSIRAGNQRNKPSMEASSNPTEKRWEGRTQ